MGDLLAGVVGEARAAGQLIARIVIWLALFGLISWPFGGPFHLIHFVSDHVVDGVMAMLHWSGWPGT